MYYIGKSPEQDIRWMSEIIDVNPAISPEEYRVLTGQPDLSDEHVLHDLASFRLKWQTNQKISEIRHKMRNEFPGNEYSKVLLNTPLDSIRLEHVELMYQTLCSRTKLNNTKSA